MPDVLADSPSEGPKVHAAWEACSWTSIQYTTVYPIAKCLARKARSRRIGSSVQGFTDSDVPIHDAPGHRQQKGDFMRKVTIVLAAGTLVAAALATAVYFLVLRNMNRVDSAVARAPAGAPIIGYCMDTDRKFAYTYIWDSRHGGESWVGENNRLIFGSEDAAAARIVSDGCKIATTEDNPLVGIQRDPNGGGGGLFACCAQAP